MEALSPETPQRHRADQGHPSTTDPRKPDDVALVFQAASLLLDYPGTESADLVDLVGRTLHAIPAGDARRRLERFLGWWGAFSDRERETTYVETFDMSAKNCLQLFSRREGDKRLRGRALLDLKETYRRYGLELATGESPDHLPLMLEFAAAVPHGRSVLESERSALESLRHSLEVMESPFAEVVGAVLAAFGKSPREEDLEPRTDNESRPR